MIVSAFGAVGCWLLRLAVPEGILPPSGRQNDGLVGFVLSHPGCVRMGHPFSCCWWVKSRSIRLRVARSAQDDKCSRECGLSVTSLRGVGYVHLAEAQDEALCCATCFQEFGEFYFDYVKTSRLQLCGEFGADLVQEYRSACVHCVAGETQGVGFGDTDSF